MLCFAALPDMLSIPVEELADDEQLLELPSRNNLLIAPTVGTVVLSHKFSFINLSRISQEKAIGFSRLISSILFSISGEIIRGLLPPITPGLMLPVSLKREQAS